MNSDPSEDTGLMLSIGNNAKVLHSRCYSVGYFSKIPFYVSVCTLWAKDTWVRVPGWGATRECWIPWSWGGCEPLDMGSGTQTQVLCETSACPYSQNHLSGPSVTVSFLFSHFSTSQLLLDYSPPCIILYVTSIIFPSFVIANTVTLFKFF